MGAEAESALVGGGLLGAVPAPVAVAWELPLAPVPPGLTLDRVARSHGWSALPPFGYDGVNQRLHRILHLPTTTAVWVDADWIARSGTALGPREAESARTQLRWCLGLDDDVSGAPEAVRQTRMLRSPTPWEDLVKTLFTTNCSWAATTRMVTRLVAVHGRAGSFPGPLRIYGCSEEQLRADLGLGYRAGALRALAYDCANGTLEEQLLDPRAADDDLVETVLRLKGFGRYSAEGMLGLLGRPRGLAVDSWIRARLHGATAAEITKRYAAHGRWAGAALWQDVTAHWFSH